MSHDDVIHLTQKALTSDRVYTVFPETPPEWIMRGCLDQFRVNVDRTFWTYGNAIYNPGRGEIPKHILAHEETHMRQQEEYCVIIKHTSVGKSTDPIEKKEGKDEWWKRYLTDPRFRLEQEAEAYGAQYRYYCKAISGDRNQQARFLHMLAGQLSGPLYQLAVTQAQARELILILSGQKQGPKMPAETV